MHEQFRMVLVLEEGQLRSGQNTGKTTQILASWVARTRPLCSIRLELLVLSDFGDWRSTAISAQMVNNVESVLLGQVAVNGTF